MTLRIQGYKEFRCDRCGHTQRMYDTVPEEHWPKECPKCKEMPPKDFDYPLLKEAIEEVLDTYRIDCQRYMDGRAETLLEDIENELQWRLREKNNELTRNSKNGSDNSPS